MASRNKRRGGMKTGIRVGGPASGGREQFEAMLEWVAEAEKLGIDIA